MVTAGIVSASETDLEGLATLGMTGVTSVTSLTGLLTLKGWHHTGYDWCDQFDWFTATHRATLVCLV